MANRAGGKWALIALVVCASAIVVATLAVTVGGDADQKKPAFEVAIISAPPSKTSSASAEFQFLSTNPRATTYCSLDGAPATICTSPKVFTGLEAGSRKFTVTGKWETDGTTQEVLATHSWKIDKEAVKVGPDASPTLSVSVTGSGSVVGDPGGIDCGDVCSAGLAAGTEVALSATPTRGWRFDGWSGQCKGKDSCLVVVEEPTDIRASFVRNLTVKASFPTPQLRALVSETKLGQLIIGTPGADRLKGGPGADIIYGLGGNDLIDGGGGADLIIGGPGNDNLKGGTGNDRLLGGAGSDELRGLSGNDAIAPGFLEKQGKVRDQVFSGSGEDTAFMLPGDIKFDDDEEEDSDHRFKVKPELYKPVFPYTLLAAGSKVSDGESGPSRIVGLSTAINSVPKRIDGPVLHSAYPSWSPWQNQFAYDYAGDLYVATAEGQIKQKSQEKYGPGRAPAWSPDGDEIAVAITGSQRGILVYDTSGHRFKAHDTRAIEMPGLIALTDLSWSPDGRYLAFVAMILDDEGGGVLGTDKDYEVFTVRADGKGSPVRLTSNNYVDHSPKFSPDGRFLAYASGGTKDTGSGLSISPFRLWSIDLATGKARLTEDGDFLGLSFGSNGMLVTSEVYFNSKYYEARKPPTILSLLACCDLSKPSVIYVPAKHPNWFLWGLSAR